MNMLRHDAHVCNDAHEIRIPIPSGNDVDMEVIFNPRTGSFTQVYPDIDPLRQGDCVQNVTGYFDEIEKIEDLLARQTIQVRHMTKGRHQEMAVAVRIAIQHDKRKRGAVQDKVFPVS